MQGSRNCGSSFFLYLGQDETLLYTSKSGGAVIDVCQCTVLLVRGVTPKPEFLTINALVTGQKKKEKKMKLEHIK